MLIQKAIEIFITALKYEQLSLHTVRAYHQDLLQWKSYMSKEDLDGLEFSDFQNYLITIQSLELKTSSIKRKRVVIHRFLKFCYNKQLCSKELFNYIDPIKSKKTSKPKEVLSEEDIKAIFTYIKDECTFYASKKEGSAHYEYLYYCSVRNELILSILLYTGCRANEVVSLKKSDIKHEQNTLTLLTKGSKYNTIPIHEALQMAFLEYEKGLECIKESDLYTELEKSTYLFPSRGNKEEHLATRTLHDLMKRLEKVINRPLHAHIFRHTFASYCIAAHMDISTISSLISHSNPSITLSIYTHEIDAMQKQRELSKLKFQLD